MNQDRDRVTDITPPNKNPKRGFRITEMFAYVMLDRETDEEGVPAFMTKIFGDEVMMPMIGADRSRVESMRAEAKKLARFKNQPIKLLRFTSAEVIEEIEP